MTAALVFGSLVAVLTDFRLWLLMLAAIPMGMIFGAVPGLGGKLGLVIAIPFVFGMHPLHGAVFLLAMHAVVHTGGAIPSILLGIPGTGPDAATVCDGYPMTRRGEAGRALGASLAASAVGGVIGAIFLAVLIPVVQPLVLAFGPAEFFLLAVLGISFIGAVSGRSLGRGILTGVVGLLLSFVGSEPLAGISRFSWGLEFLADGVGVMTAVLAIFTVPETIALALEDRSATAATSPRRYRVAELVQGVVDVWIHRALTLRSSLLGAAIGLVPGLGGDVGSWTCYGHAVWSSRSPERFGTGVVEGVIAPEAANNSKEGGALLPTLFFGIPGSSGMAILLGAFTVLGLQPGPGMLRDHLDLVWTLIWTLVVANVLAALVFFAAGRWLVLVVSLRPGVLVPFVLLLTLVGAHVASGAAESLLVLVALGVLGYGFKRCDWPRAPFVIGIVLGPIMEISLHQALALWGWAFLLRGPALVLLAAIAATLLLSRRRLRRTAAAAVARVERAVAAAVFLLILAAVAAAWTYPPRVGLVPLLVGIPGLGLAGWILAGSLLSARSDITGAQSTPAGPDVPSGKRELRALAWLFAFALLAGVGGLVIGGTLAVVASHRLWLRESWRVSLAGGGTALLVTSVAFEALLGVPLFDGWILERFR